MHIEPLIRQLKKGWISRILLYVITNIGLAFIIEIWKFSIFKIILIIVYMICYIIAYENLGIMYDRIKKNKYDDIK